MADNNALLELARRAADAADEARDAAQAVALDLRQTMARVDALEGAARVAAKPERPDLTHKLLDKVAERPVIIVYVGLAVALAMGGPAAVSIASSLAPGVPHAAPPTP